MQATGKSSKIIVQLCMPMDKKLQIENKKGLNLVCYQSYDQCFPTRAL